MVRTRAAKRKAEDEKIVIVGISSPRLSVSDPPVALTSPLVKTRSRKVAVRGKFIGNINEATGKSERIPLVTAETLCTDKFLSNFDQAPAEKEPQNPSTLPSSPPNNPLVSVQRLGIDDFFSTFTETPAQEEPQFSSTLPANQPHNVALQNCTLNSKEARDFNPDMPTPSESLGITMMAAMANYDDLDDEVDSEPNSGLENVNGYKVKMECAPVLRDVLFKHGDIAESCPLLMQSFSLEKVCDIIKLLKNSSFTDLTRHKLQSVLGEIGDLEKVGLRVGWLRKRVEDINEAKAKFMESSSLKSAKMKNKKALDENVKAMSLLEEKFAEMNEKMAEMKKKVAELEAESERINSTARQTQTIVKCFYGKPLADGLL